MDTNMVFINVILLATSASNMPPMHSICHLKFFRYLVDGRNHFKKSRTDLGAKSVYANFLCYYLSEETMQKKKKKKKHFLVLVWESLFVLVYLILKIKRVKDQPFIPINLNF